MKKQLLILVPSLKLGGQERVAVNTANIMSEVYNVHIAVFDNTNAVYSPTCEVININVPAVNSKVGKIINIFKRAVKFKKIRRQLRVDYVISFGTSADIVNVLSRGCGKTFLNIRGYSSVNKSIAQKYFYIKSDGIICCSKEIAEQIKQIVPKKSEQIFALSNPYNLNEIYELAKEDVPDYNFDKTTLIMHGRLDSVKNFPRLIKAFKIVKTEKSDTQLLIVGEGDMRQQLQDLINYHGLQEDVEMIGFRKNPYAYISRASLYVLSSYSEGFPNALVEGMAFLPAVSVDCKSGPREILYKEYDGLSSEETENADFGILVPAAMQNEFDYDLNCDDKVLADGILSVLSDASKYSHYKNAAQTRVKDFSFETYKINLLNILGN